MEKRINTSELPEELFQNWVHSFEEDSCGITVYRTSQYTFLTSRGRTGIGFGPDGTFIDWSIAPTDGTKAITGHWHVERPGELYVSFEDKNRASWILELLHVDSDMLKVRRRQGNQ